MRTDCRTAGRTPVSPHLCRNHHSWSCQWNALKVQPIAVRVHGRTSKAVGWGAIGYCSLYWILKREWQTPDLTLGVRGSKSQRQPGGCHRSRPKAGGGPRRSTVEARVPRKDEAHGPAISRVGFRKMSGEQWRPENWTRNTREDPDNPGFSRVTAPLNLRPWRKPVCWRSSYPVSSSRGRSVKGEDNPQALSLFLRMTSWPMIPAWPGDAENKRARGKWQHPLACTRRSLPVLPTRIRGLLLEWLHTEKRYPAARGLTNLTLTQRCSTEGHWWGWRVGSMGSRDKGLLSPPLDSRLNGLWTYNVLYFPSSVVSWGNGNDQPLTESLYWFSDPCGQGQRKERISEGLLSGLGKKPQQVREPSAPCKAEQTLSDQGAKGTNCRCQSTSFPAHLSATQGAPIRGLWWERGRD